MLVPNSILLALSFLRKRQRGQMLMKNEKQYLSVSGANMSQGKILGGMDIVLGIYIRKLSLTMKVKNR